MKTKKITVKRVGRYPLLGILVKIFVFPSERKAVEKSREERRREILSCFHLFLPARPSDTLLNIFCPVRLRRAIFGRQQQKSRQKAIEKNARAFNSSHHKICFLSTHLEPFVVISLMFYTFLMGFEPSNARALIRFLLRLRHSVWDRQ